MTDSDLKMDRDLRELSSLEPARSVWTEVEKHIVRQEKNRRRRVAVRYSIPALAASLMLALLVFSNQNHRLDDGEPAIRKNAGNDPSIQKTVENAVRDARPQPAFSNLEYDKGRLTLEAILVSSKPRQAEIVPAGNIPADQAQGEERKNQPQPEVNEF